MTKIYKKIQNSRLPIIMGILNITPDSFSDGGKYFSLSDATTHAIQLIDEGAEIIDIGGESTRPGSVGISIDEEISRVIPIIKEVLSVKPETVISIDTYKSEVAEEAIKCGAKIINDISAGTFDPKIFKVAANYRSPIILMHIKGEPKNMQDDPSYDNVIEEISSYFNERINYAHKHSVQKIILDPGIGFGKRLEDNYCIIQNLEKFKEFNYPLLIGLSKKSFLGKSLNLDISQRQNSTTVMETISVLNGANILRTHNVKNAVELKNILNFLKNS